MRVRRDDAGRRRRVCVVLVDRANYGRLKPVMLAMREHPALELLVLAAGTMVLERFQQPVNVVRNDGFTVDGELYMELEGSTPTTMAKSVGFGIVEFCNEFQRLKPDVVVLIGDRYEALSAAIAAAYMNLSIVHIQGGEVSGSIDESARHAISKFAHFHFPSTDRSAEYLVRMGERPDSILGTGCPSSDIARMLDRTLPSEMVNQRGAAHQLMSQNRSCWFCTIRRQPNTAASGYRWRRCWRLLARFRDRRFCYGQTLMPAAIISARRSACFAISGIRIGCGR